MFGFIGTQFVCLELSLAFQSEHSILCLIIMSNYMELKFLDISITIGCQLLHADIITLIPTGGVG